MAKRMMFFAVVVVSMLSFSALSWANVTGKWDITGTVKAKVSVKKGPSGSQTVGFSDQFTFDADNTFYMIDMDGTWSQSKTKFSVHLDPLDIASYIQTNVEDLASSYGYDVSVTNVNVTKNSFTGKENKTGDSISGKYNLAVSFLIYVYDLGMELSGKATFTGTYSGTRALVLSPLGNSKAVPRYNSPDGMDALLYPLVEAIMGSIVTPDAGTLQ